MYFPSAYLNSLSMLTYLKLRSALRCPTSDLFYSVLMPESLACTVLSALVDNTVHAVSLILMNVNFGLSCQTWSN